MKTNRLASLLLLVILAPGVSLASGEAPMELRWDQLAPVIEGRQVEITIQNGEHKNGMVLCVLVDSLDLKKGKAVEHLPRTSIATLVVINEKRKWRWIGAVLGYSAVAAPISARSKFGGEALQGPPILGVLACGVLGYYVGREADRKQTTIKILPN